MTLRFCSFTGYIFYQVRIKDRDIFSQVFSVRLKMFARGYCFSGGLHFFIYFKSGLFQLLAKTLVHVVIVLSQQLHIGIFSEQYTSTQWSVVNCSSEYMTLLRMLWAMLFSASLTHGLSKKTL